MKKSFLILILLGLSMCVYSICFAQSTDLTARTFMPEATGLTIATSKIDANDEEDPLLHSWIPGDAGTTLDMGNLKELSGVDALNRKWIVFLPEFYFAVDIAPFGGGLAATSRIIVSQFSETMPTGATVGLGVKGNITYVKTVLTDWAANLTEDTLLEKLRYMDEKTITPANIANGWLRLYIGTANGNLLPCCGLPGDATGSQIFSPGDIGGTYSSILRVTFMP